jgi:hypothetical protein
MVANGRFFESNQSSWTRFDFAFDLHIPGGGAVDCSTAQSVFRNTIDFVDTLFPDDSGLPT